MGELRMSWVDHLEELRRRLLFYLAVLVLASAGTFQYSEALLKWIARPAAALVFTAPAEAFLTRLKVALWGGFLLSLPVLLYEAWRFAAPALTEREKKAWVWVCPASLGLFALGGGLALFIVVPNAMRFLLAFGTEELTPMLSVGAYLKFVVSLSLAFGVLFQLPLALLFLNTAGLVSPEGLSTYRRHVYLGSFVAAAVLTPGPDVFSQVLLAGSTVLLFELSLAVLRLAGSRSAAASITPQPSVGPAGLS